MNKAFGNKFIVEFLDEFIDCAKQYCNEKLERLMRGPQAIGDAFLKAQYPEICLLNIMLLKGFSEGIPAVMQLYKEKAIELNELKFLQKIFVPNGEQNCEKSLLELLIELPLYVEESGRENVFKTVEAVLCNLTPDQKKSMFQKDKLVESLKQLQHDLLKVIKGATPEAVETHVAKNFLNMAFILYENDLLDLQTLTSVVKIWPGAGPDLVRTMNGAIRNFEDLKQQCLQTDGVNVDVQKALQKIEQRVDSSYEGLNKDGSDVSKTKTTPLKAVGGFFKKGPKGAQSHVEYGGNYGLTDPLLADGAGTSDAPLSALTASAAGHAKEATLAPLKSQR